MIWRFGFGLGLDMEKGSYTMGKQRQVCDQGSTLQSRSALSTLGMVVFAKKACRNLIRVDIQKTCSDGLPGKPGLSPIPESCRPEKP